MESDGANPKSIQQDLFLKKLWFRALHTRGMQRERELKKDATSSSPTSLEQSKKKHANPDEKRWQNKTRVAKFPNSSDLYPTLSCQQQLTFDLPPAPLVQLRSSAFELAAIAQAFRTHGVCLLRFNATRSCSSRKEEEQSSDPEAAGLGSGGDYGCGAGTLSAVSEAALSRLAWLRKRAEAAGVGGEDTRLKAVELVRANTSKYDNYHNAPMRTEHEVTSSIVASFFSS